MRIPKSLPITALLVGGSLAAIGIFRAVIPSTDSSANEADSVIAPRGIASSDAPKKFHRLLPGRDATRERQTNPRWLRRHAGFLGRSDPRRAWSTFRNLASIRDRTRFMRGLFHRFGKDSREGAVELALRFQGRDRQLALRTLLANQWPRLASRLPNGTSPSWRVAALLAANPRNDLSFLASTVGRLLPAEKAADVLAPAVIRAAGTNAAAAAAIAGSLSPGNGRRQAVAGVGGRWAYQDTAAALAWADTLPPADRATARSAIQDVAPVGIGVALRADSSPYPLAMQSVPGGPAARSGAIGQGDHIVAVLDPGNTWTETTGRNLDSIIGLIRGSAGQPVQIRVLPAGVTDPAQARTITLVREQVLLRTNPGS